MTGDGIFQLLLYLVVLNLLALPLGRYMARVFSSERTLMSPLLAPLEGLIYKICRINHTQDMGWKLYAASMLTFNGLGLFAVYLIQRMQNVLPLNPQSLGAVSADSSLNTSISFVSNTNWQGYGGEVTMSYFTQMIGLNVQNFVSSATGIACLIALVRGLVRQESLGIGNFWSDMVRATLYVLLPLSLLVSILLSSQGVVQTFQPYAAYSRVEEIKSAKPSSGPHFIALGPAASQIAIKQLGTNGGGFFNVNSSHPLENPNPLTNFVECISILLISAALCHTFGKMVNDSRQGWAVLAAMSVIFLASLAICFTSESSLSPALSALGVDATSSTMQPGGNMEGKETRFGIANSALWATATTAASNGSVNSMHDSYNPIGGLVPMLLMQLGEVIYGGVGSGLYGMLVFAIITVFIAGLMVGRTPEYLGKKIEAFEVKMSSLVILFPPAVVLIGTAIAVSLEVGRSSVLNSGPHGFSEILYAFSSAGNNNGSAFAGLNANTPFYNYALGIAMFIARYWLVVPVIAIAGSLARKKRSPESLGTMPTHNALFVSLLTGVVLIFGALTFVPSLALGPIVEHLMMVSDLSQGVSAK